MSSIPQIEPRDPVLLDLLSTSQTTPSKCIHNAPFICVPPQNGKDGSLFQLCCNDWLCPRCGEMRARQEYGRIVNGARILAERHELYFLTLTCTGSETRQQAEAAYLERTNRLITSFRTHVKRQKPPGHWSYAQVTERQGRGHPHSHLITSCAPADAFYPVSTEANYEKYVRSVATINSQIAPEMRFTATPRDEMSLLDLHSEWLMLQAAKAGLGVQARISVIDSVEAASRYVAKYLFKASMKTHWSKGWKRVRYSHSFPKLPKPAPTGAFPLVHAADWQRAADLPGVLVCHSPQTYERALLMRCYNALLVTQNESS